MYMIVVKVFEDREWTQTQFPHFSPLEETLVDKAKEMKRYYACVGIKNDLSGAIKEV